MCGSGPPTGINLMREHPSRWRLWGKHKVLRGGSWLEVQDETANRYLRCANRLHAPPNYTASNIGFRCVRDVAPATLNPDAAGEEVPVYPTQISAELLNKYVRQQRSKNLQIIRKRALNAALLISALQHWQLARVTTE